jgi:hypothetical protein
MPFDGANFLSGQQAAVAGRTQLCGALGRALRAVLFRIAPDPLDSAMLRVLEEARGLIAEREDWVQGSYETYEGARCAVGALRLAADFLDYAPAGDAAHALLARIARERGYGSVEALNDHSRHETVLALFDAAIAKMRS